MEKLKLDNITLKKFGITMGFAFFAITLFLLIRHKHNILPTTIISTIFFIYAITYPALLKPIYLIWMRFALILAWVNTRIILLAMFYLIFTPIGLALRLFRVDLLYRKIDKNKQSYWRAKEKKEFSLSNYERQF